MKTLLATALAVLFAGCGGEDGPIAPHPVPKHEEHGKDEKQKPRPAADNSRCFVCHGNLEEDALAKVHGAKGIGCEMCHGPSDDHCGDEGHETPPEVMFPREKIAEGCWHCHTGVKPKADFEPPAGAETGKVCTECHFNHRLERREIRWDKKTGKLLE